MSSNLMNKRRKELLYESMKFRTEKSPPKNINLSKLEKEFVKSKPPNKPKSTIYLNGPGRHFLFNSKIKNALKLNSI